MGVVVRVSVVDSGRSTNHSSCTADRLAVAEKVQAMVASWLGRMTVEPSPVCAWDLLITTGLGTLRVTAWAAPGVGPVSGEASQLAGSLEPPVTLTRCRDRPLYW